MMSMSDSHDDGSLGGIVSVQLVILARGSRRLSEDGTAGHGQPAGMLARRSEQRRLLVAGCELAVAVLAPPDLADAQTLGAADTLGTGITGPTERALERSSHDEITSRDTREARV